MEDEVESHYEAIDETLPEEILSLSPELLVESDVETTKESLIQEDLALLQKEEVIWKYFKTLDEAYEYYNEHARQKGFSIRSRDQKKRKEDGFVRIKEWTCAKEGKRRKSKKKDSTEESTGNIRKRRPSDETRCYCPAKFRIIWVPEEKKYRVTNFEPEHNHDMTMPEHVRFLRSHGKMTEGDKEQIINLRKLGVLPTSIIKVLEAQAGGRANVGYTHTQVYNLLHSHSMKQVTDGDCMRAIGYLENKQIHDEGSFYDFTTTEDHSLGSIFWCDSMCKYDYHCFGDVLAFDATYKSNLYKKPLVMLLGVNHHFQTCFFGVAVIENETKETYEWLLRTFLHAMGDKHPLAVMTDGCPAMAAAISEVLPNANHRLCLWHLVRNIMEKLKNENFARAFHNFALEYSPSTFEDKWTELLKDHGVTDEFYVQQQLYDKKEMWSESFLKGVFFAHMTTTQRCESMNAHQQNHMGKNLKLHKVVERFDEEFARIRANEALEEHKTRHGSRPSTDNQLRELDEHAARVYTKRMYEFVRLEISDCHGFVLLERSEVGGNVLFRIRKYREEEVYTVVHNSNDDTYACQCKHFDSRGYPCSHQFFIFKILNLAEIPSSLINKRWTINAKDTLVRTEETNHPPDVIKKARIFSLNSICKNIICSGCDDGQTFNKTRVLLTKVWDNMVIEKNAAKDKGKQSQVVKDPTKGVRDPPIKKRKKGKKKTQSKAPTKKTPTNEGCPSGTSKPPLNVNAADSTGEATSGGGGGSQAEEIPNGIDTVGNSCTASLRHRIPRPPRRCSFCRQIGHFVTHCPAKKLTPENAINVSTQSSNNE